MSFPAASSSGWRWRGRWWSSPRCLLLDEPLSNLDSRLRVEMRGEIRRLCKEFGLTAIYVSHDQKEALAIGDRVVVMDAGRIRQAGARWRFTGSRGRALWRSFWARRICSEGTAGVERGGDLDRRRESLDVIAGRSARCASRGQVLCSRSGRRRGGSAREPEAVNSFPGRIVETVYLGEMARHRFALRFGRGS